MADAVESIPCYGKINLFLEVQERRSDGFHNLGSLFHTVACCDRLEASRWYRLELDCPDGITPDRGQNLVFKAARLFLDSFRDRLPADAGVRFRLEKHLPSGAGLGGGSSDAAAALVLCNRIWGLGLGLAELLPLAARLGSDVPFFLYGGSCFAEGRGEVLSPAPTPYPFHIVIGTPHCAVETGWAYGQLPPGRKSEWSKFKPLYITYHEEWKFYHVLRNDFHHPMQASFAPIRDLTALMSGFSPVKTLLSGSGASVFALFTQKTQAESCLEAIRGSCRYACLTAFTE